MKGVIFDLDGTMVDNMMVHHRAWQKKLKELGLDMTLEEVRKQIHGINDEIFIRLFGDRFTVAERKQLAYEKEEAYRAIYKSEIKLIDGLSVFLETLHDRGVPMAIGSAAPYENVDFVLDKLNLRCYFKTVLHAGDVEKGKPDPEIYLKCASGLHLTPEDCVVFEDSPTGAEAAIRAGCKLVIITTTHSQVEFSQFLKVEKFVPDFRDINWQIFREF
ncbi:MAG TPA: HAD family phosphatase [Cyclobacteriaceae bacterium]